MAAHATQAGLSARRADDLVIAVHELAANVVRHGSGHGLAAHLAASPGAALPGHRRRPAGAGQHRAGAGQHRGGQASTEAPPWRVEPGHGLWLVRQLADEIELHPGPQGTAVTISFGLGTQGAVPEPFTPANTAEGAIGELPVPQQPSESRER